MTHTSMKDTHRNGHSNSTKERAESKLKDTKRKATPMLSGVGPTRMMERVLCSIESKGATITFSYFSSGLVSALFVCHLASCHFPICPSCLSLGFLSLPCLPFSSVTWLPVTSLSAVSSRLSLGFLSLPCLPFLLVCHLASPSPFFYTFTVLASR